MFYTHTLRLSSLKESSLLVRLLQQSFGDILAPTNAQGKDKVEQTLLCILMHFASTCTLDHASTQCVRFVLSLLGWRH